MFLRTTGQTKHGWAATKVRILREFATTLERSNRRTTGLITRLISQRQLTGCLRTKQRISTFNMATNGRSQRFQTRCPYLLNRFTTIRTQRTSINRRRISMLIFVVGRHRNLFTTIHLRRLRFGFFRSVSSRRTRSNVIFSSGSSKHFNKRGEDSRE